MDTSDAVAYIDGDFVPRDEATISIDDPGFRWGYNVVDVLRTFRHEPFELEKHVDRFIESATSARMTLDRDRTELIDVIREVVERSRPSLEGAHDDLTVAFYLSGAPTHRSGTSSSFYAVPDPIHFERFARRFRTGQKLVTTRTRQLSPQAVSPKIKHCSRMHFVLADTEAKAVDADAEPLVLDQNGNIAEVRYANVFIVSDGVLRTPPLEHVLPGITRQLTLERARETLEMPVTEEHLHVSDVYNADEMFCVSTSPVVMPVTAVDGVTIGDGDPGPVTDALLAAHSEYAGIDIVEQFLSKTESTAGMEELSIGGYSL